MSHSPLILQKKSMSHTCANLQYEKASTVLSVGSIRQQFSTPGNVQMSMYSMQFLRDIAAHLSVPGEDPPDVQLHENGYLLLARRATEDVMRENFNLQRCGIVIVHTSIACHTSH